MSVVATGLFGQNAATPAFEVASVKAATPDQSIVDFVVSPGGRLRVVNLTLAEIMRQAYVMKHFQLTGGPGWLDTDRFNIDAKAAGEPTRSELMAMLRSLLGERFHLRVRREMREVNVYELIVAGRGPKLKPSTADTSFLRLNRNTPPELPGVSYTILGQKVSMARLADDLSGTVQRPVSDRTGITGDFDFQIDYAVEGHAETGPSIFTALPDQLGLRLRAAKGPVETLIVENAGRPAAN
jgi:uncharacterized protein (TIGR03435 family)